MGKRTAVGRIGRGRRPLAAGEAAHRFSRRASRFVAGMNPRPSTFRGRVWRFVARRAVSRKRKARIERLNGGFQISRFEISEKSVDAALRNMSVPDHADRDLAGIAGNRVPGKGKTAGLKDGATFKSRTPIGVPSARCVEKAGHPSRLSGAAAADFRKCRA